MRSVFERVLEVLRRYDAWLYFAWAALLAVRSAHAFYAAMLEDTHGVWSAPLDDVFIHFDFARATAQGYPFQWTAGNGVSSGNTSLTYPLALAVGWLVGFRDLALMKFAAFVAVVSVVALLLVVRRFVLGATGEDDAPEPQGTFTALRALSYALPPVLLGLGALDWSLWSGMEVAFFLGIWAGATRAFFVLEAARPHERARRALQLGLWGAVLVATRPESATTIAALGLFAASSRSVGGKDRLRLLLRAGLPAVLLLALQAMMNRIFTGETSANGALVKLALNNPFMTPAEKAKDWFSNFEYTIFRNIEYHFTDDRHYSAIIPGLALIALCVKETRKLAALLWIQILGWTALVALNGQVRWQNERYTMPAVAWLLVAAVLGATGLARKKGRPAMVITGLAFAFVAEMIATTFRPENVLPSFAVGPLPAIAIGLAAVGVLWLWPMRIALVVACAVLAELHQQSRMKDQIGFFARASRNIYDQHVVTGRKLAHDVEPRPHRVLVGDAGALLYASGLPGLDIIGLGGYHDLPFARAGVQGLPATLELIERMPENDRPDVMAIYPSWWGVLPELYGKELFRTPAEGNVICGGYEDVVYRADWHGLGTGAKPRRALPPGKSLIDEIDVSDLVSERAHGYVFPHPAGGWTSMKTAADPSAPGKELWDAGRTISPGQEETMRLEAVRKKHAVVVVLRTSGPDATRLCFTLTGVGSVEETFPASDGWVERDVTLPAPEKDAPELRIANIGARDSVDYHLWIAQ